MSSRTKILLLVGIPLALLLCYGIWRVSMCFILKDAEVTRGTMVACSSDPLVQQDLGLAADGGMGYGFWKSGHQIGSSATVGMTISGPAGSGYAEGTAELVDGFWVMRSVHYTDRDGVRHLLTSDRAVVQ